MKKQFVMEIEEASKVLAEHVARKEMSALDWFNSNVMTEIINGKPRFTITVERTDAPLGNKP